MVLVLFACSTPETAPAPADESAASDGALDPAPYLLDDTAAAAAPALDAEEVAEAIGASIEAVLALDPVHLADAYEGIWAGRDEDCPYYYPEYLELYDQYIWTDSCTSDQGYRFDGYAYYMAYHGYVGSYYTYDRYFYLYTSSMSIADPAGESLTGSGYAYYYDIDYWYYGYRAGYGLIQGTFDWEGPSYQDSWLSRRLSVDLAVASTYYPAGYRYLSLNGSLGDVSETVTAVNFDSVYLESANTGTACGLEPSGSIRVRDAEGTWYEVAFDGPAYSGATSFPAHCDGCGDVWWRGENLGVACPDFSALVSWESDPWH